MRAIDRQGKIRHIMRQTSMRDKMIVGFFVLLILTVVVIYFGLYRQTMDLMTRKVEDSVHVIANSVSTQVEEQFLRMETITNIIRGSRNNQSLYLVDGLPYIDQLRMYWDLYEEMKALSGYFSEYQLMIYFDEESLFAKDDLWFSGRDSIEEKGIYDRIVGLHGQLFWTEDTYYVTRLQQNEPVLATYRLLNPNVVSEKDYAILRLSITKERILQIFTNTQETLPVNYYLLDSQGATLVTSTPKEQQMTAFDLQTKPEYGGTARDQRLLYNPLSVNDWTIVTTVNTEYYSQATAQTRTSFFIILLVLFSVFFIVMIIMWNSFNRRVTNINTMLGEIESKNFSKRLQTDYNDELSRVEVRINKFIDTIQVLMQDIVAIEQKKKKSDMMALQAQIKPHFIYNTLDSINWLAIDREEYEIADALVNLAQYFRKSLAIDQDFVTLREEVEYTLLYIEILQGRTDCQILYEVDVPHELLDIPVVKFVLQPLVENAIIHGFLNSGYEQGKIWISGTKSEHTMRLTVRDNGIGFHQKTTEGGRGVGLKNIRDRIQLFHGSESQVEITSQPGTGTTACISWPVVPSSQAIESK